MLDNVSHDMKLAGSDRDVVGSIQSVAKVAKSVTRENFTIILVVILILYVGTTVFPLTRHRCWRDLDSILYALSRVRTLFVTRCFFFPQDQRVFILEHYFFTRSYAECQNAFRNSFPDSVTLNKSTIQRLVERFRETGSIGEKRRSCRPSVLSNDSLEDVRARLFQSPRKSLRKLSQQSGMTYGSVQRATKRLKLPMGFVTFGSLCISNTVLV
jgi:hypothetical protein